MENIIAKKVNCCNLEKLQFLISFGCCLQFFLTLSCKIMVVRMLCWGLIKLLLFVVIFLFFLLIFSG